MSNMGGVYLRIKAARGSGSGGSYDVQSDPRRPAWNDIDVEDDDAVEMFRRRRDRQNKRLAQFGGLGMGALGGVYGALLGGAEGGAGGAALGGLAGAAGLGLGTYGLSRGAAWLGSKIEDTDIDDERAALAEGKARREKR